jgi:hypothetical protein
VSARGLPLRARGAASLAVLSAAIALVVASPGCEVLLGTCGDELADTGPARYTDGTTQDGVYRSSSWDPEDLVELAPGQLIRFEHGLGAEPTSFQVYVAASRTGDGAKLVLAAGNEVELIAIDDEAITIKNGTCSDLFMLMVAESRPAG